MFSEWLLMFSHHIEGKFKLTCSFFKWQSHQKTNINLWLPFPTTLTVRLAYLMSSTQALATAVYKMVDKLSL
jgi:hypothetical protein